MSLRELHGRRVGVWGYGVEGREAVRLLRDRAEPVLVLDEHTDPRALRGAAAADGLEVIELARVDATTVHEVIRSPGISRYRADVEHLRSIGVESRCLTAHWLDDQDPGTVVGVTGTKGKSTTAALTAALLRAAGVAAEHVGNVGVTPSSAPTAVVSVLEVSSYQAADMLVSPAHGALTTLTEDHLDWHGDLGRYRADKLRLFAHPQLRTLVLGPTITRDSDELALVASSAQRHHVDAAVDLGVDLSETELAAPHMRDNLAVAVRIASELTPIGPALVARVAHEHVGLPHRLERIAVVDGVTWIDDALGSNPTATAAALDAQAGTAGRVILILGGADRGVSYDALVARLGRHAERELVVLVGEVGARLRGPLSAVGAAVVSYLADELPDAVEVAADVAHAGDVVLFSPAAPTPTGHGNYADRGRRFRDAVAALGSADR